MVLLIWFGFLDCLCASTCYLLLFFAVSVYCEFKLLLGVPWPLLG